MLTIIDRKIIEFELLVFELCLFFLQKYPKIKFCYGSLYSEPVINATVSLSIVNLKYLTHLTYLSITGQVQK